MLLRTKRTQIVPISISDAPFFVHLLNTSDWLQFIGDRNVQTVKDAEQYLRGGFLKSYAEHGFGYYLVRLHSGTPMGICGFLKKPHLQYPDFGFALMPEFCGQGIGHEAALAVRDFGLQHLAMIELDAEVSPDNDRSIRLLRKLGFLPVGRRNQKAKLTDLYHWKAEEQV